MTERKSRALQVPPVFPYRALENFFKPEHQQSMHVSIFSCENATSSMLVYDDLTDVTKCAVAETSRRITGQRNREIVGTAGTEEQRNSSHRETEEQRNSRLIGTEEQ